MAKNVNKVVASKLILAALAFNQGRRKQAAEYLDQVVNSDDFVDTVEGLEELVKNDGFNEDPFDSNEPDEDDFDDLEEFIPSTSASASIAGTARRLASANPDLSTGESKGDVDNDNKMNDNSGVIRQVAEARLSRVQRNVQIMASKTGK